MQAVMTRFMGEEGHLPCSTQVHSQIRACNDRAVYVRASQVLLTPFTITEKGESGNMRPDPFFSLNATFPKFVSRASESFVVGS